MKKVLLTVMSLSLFAACSTHKADSSDEALTSGIDMANLDTTASPVNDFFQYAGGGWMKANPLDDQHARYGAFDKLGDENREQLKSLIDSIASAKNQKGSNAEKIATFFNLGMDSVALQKQGAEPIQPLLKEIAALKDDPAQLQKELVALHLQGIMPFFGLFSEADQDNSKMQIAWIYQAGLGMGERDYYLDKKFAALSSKYEALMEKEFAMAGYDKMSNISAKDLAKMVMRIETRLAKAQYDRDKQRNPKANFHRMSVAEAASNCPKLDMAGYFKAMGLPQIGNFNMAQPEFMKEVSNIFGTEKAESIKAYYAWNVINEAASYLSDDFVQANFDFFGKEMSGVPQMQPRWKRVTNTVNGALSEAIGQIYVEKYFPAEAKQRMITLVDNLKEAFAQRIKGADWMEQATKDKALEKLQAILVKVGYPDKWRDYSKLEIKNDSYFANVLRANSFEVAYTISKVNKPTDRDEWGMPPQMVNAYYNPSTNEICFPAAILQPPFFNMKADDAVNYGAIGVVIGHEMTHGFDDQGRQYDKEGNLNNWWSEKDAENFTNNSKVLVDHFNGIQVLESPKLFANGSYTLGENIADNGGINISYVALQNAIKKGQVNAEAMDGFTPAQRFFLAYARLWAGNIRDKEIERLTLQDVHSLGRWRVNGTLPHITEFLEAFGVKEGDAMYLAPEKRVHLW